LSRTYLVTGGAGFIGSHFCEALLARGDAVVVLDDLSSGKRSNLASATGPLTFIEGDIRDLAALDSQIPPVDAVVHLAALISGQDSLRDPDTYDEVNVRGTMRVIEFCARRKIPRLVFASSSSVYGNGSAGALAEDGLQAPITTYALTKLTGEHLLSIYGKIHGFSHCSLRFFNVYGPRQAEDHPYANVTCKFSHAAANGLTVNLYGDGEQSRDFIYVADVVKAVLAVLDGSREQVYNVGTGKDFSINHLLRVLEQKTGQAIPVKPCGEWSNDIRQIRADIGRLSGEFGFRPEVELDEGLAATVRFFEEEKSEPVPAL
jgi:UDP-glucose 4-epimerase